MDFDNKALVFSNGIQTIISYENGNSYSSDLRKSINQDVGIKKAIQASSIESNLKTPIYLKDNKKTIVVSAIDCRVGIVCTPNKSNCLKDRACDIKNHFINVIDNCNDIKNTTDDYSAKACNVDISNNYLNMHSFKETSALVYDITNTQTGVDIFPTVTVLVESDDIPSTGNDSQGNSESSGNIKSFKIVCQKNSFFEFRINFEASEIESVSNLPDGITFKNGYIKGVPQKSGKYEIVFEMKDKSVLECNMLIPSLQRVL